MQGDRRGGGATEPSGRGTSGFGRPTVARGTRGSGRGLAVVSWWKTQQRGYARLESQASSHALRQPDPAPIERTRLAPGRSSSGGRRDLGHHRVVADDGGSAPCRLRSALFLVSRSRFRRQEHHEVSIPRVFLKPVPRPHAGRSPRRCPALLPDPKSSSALVARECCRVGFPDAIQRATSPLGSTSDAASFSFASVRPRSPQTLSRASARSQLQDLSRTRFKNSAHYRRRVVVVNPTRQALNGYRSIAASGSAGAPGRRATSDSGSPRRSRSGLAINRSKSLLSNELRTRSRRRPATFTLRPRH